MGFHQCFLCKSRYRRLLSPYAAPARSAKHFRFEASKVNHLINTAVPTMSFLSLCGKPVVLKRLIQMTLKTFPPRSDLTQLLWLSVGTGGAAAIFKSSSGEWRSKLGAMPQPSGRCPWDSPTTVSSKFQAFFFPLYSPSPSQSFTKRPGPRKVFPNRAARFILCIQNYLLCCDR